MSNITSINTGFWSVGTTWQGGVPPVDGDTCEINQHVTVASAETVGMSPPSNGTVAIQINASGRITVASGGYLAMRGPGLVVNTGSFSLRNPLTVAAGGIFEFDASAAAAPTTSNYSFKFANNHFGYTRLLCTGTAVSRATVRANRTGGSGYFSANGQLDCLYVNATHTDFDHLGISAAQPFVNPSLRDNAEAELTFHNCSFNSVKGINCGLMGERANLSVVSSQFTNSTGTYNINGAAGQNAKNSSATRQIKDVVFDARANLYMARDMNIDNVFFLAGVETAAASRWSSMQSVFIREPTAALVIQLPTFAPIDNYYLLNDYNGIDPHFVEFHVTGSSAGTSRIKNGVWETRGNNGGAGNGLLTPSPTFQWDFDVANVIILKDDNGNASSNFIHHYSTTTYSRVSAYHSTIALPGDVGGVNPVHPQSRFLGLKDNLFWDTSVRECKVNSSGTATDGDVIFGGGGNVDFNAGSNVSGGSLGNGYTDLTFTVAPGASDVSIADPQFVNVNSRMTTWAESLGGTATRAAVLNEFSKFQSSAFSASWTLQSLLSYVRAGFAVQNSALNGTASDGSTIGAVGFKASSGGGGTGAIGLQILQHPRLRRARSGGLR